MISTVLVRYDLQLALPICNAQLMSLYEPCIDVLQYYTYFKDFYYLHQLFYTQIKLYNNTVN